MNKTIIISLLTFLFFKSEAQVSISNLKCENNAAPIGLQTPVPRFSWFLNALQRNCVQTAYRILVADDPALLHQNVGNIWDSKKTLSDNSIQVAFAGKPLKPVKTYYWKVMVWDNNGMTSDWSNTASWQMGLVQPSDWLGAKWIGYQHLPDSLRLVPAIDNPDDKRWNQGTDVLPIMRKAFSLNKPVKKATIFISGLGQFDLSLNGKKVGDHFLDPGWTKYDKHALYVTFDVTKMLKPGANVFGVMLGNGFYFIPGERYHKLKGAYGYPKMICRAVVEYTDGTAENIISDETWKTAPGPVTFSSIYGGEDFDATLVQQGWDRPGFKDSKFRNAIIVDGPPVLETQAEEPLKIFDRFSVKNITQPKPGIWVYDMGQNASAIPMISVKGTRGAKIKITPAELLDDQGLVVQKAVGTPVYFNYTLKGKGIENWQPQFMYYGFRYIQIEGAVPQTENKPGNLPLMLDVKSLHTRNSAAAIGSFNCSNDLFNRIYQLIDWAIKSNTSSIFTDCPHREKLGWLEEAHLVGSSIHYNYAIETLCRKVIRDMINSQTDDGLIPDIAPEYVQFGGGFWDSPEWGSNGIILPYYVYQWYGDKQVLEESYDMMKRYAAYLEKKSKNHILYWGLGDWYDIGPEDPGPSQLTPQGITSTAIYYYDLTLLAKTAAILHKDDDVIFYNSLSAKVKEAYNQTFFNPQTNQYGSNSQAANAISVYMGLADEHIKGNVTDHIVQDIRNHGNGVTAGDIGFRYLLRVLADAGRSDVIYDMNSRSDVPGYGFQLAQGATSLTESWQGNRISSNNHFMLGHLMEWFYTGLGGINPDENAIAYHQTIIRPEIAGNVTSASVSYVSPYGSIKNSWTKSGSTLQMRTEIPPNTSATVYLPSLQNSTITEGGKDLGSIKTIKVIGYQDGKTVLRVGSGSYLFLVQ